MSDFEPEQYTSSDYIQNVPEETTHIFNKKVLTYFENRLLNLICLCRKSIYITAGALPVIWAVSFLTLKFYFHII